jgi:hypothetical protein
MRLHDQRGRTIADWRDWTRPKEERQWRASRSAMELARAWFTSTTPVVPSELSALLRGNPLTQSVSFTDGWPELKTPLPFPGEGRNHDLVLVGEVNGKSFMCAIEGKVDETMGPPIGSYWRKSKRSGASRAWRRIDALLASAFGPDAQATRPPWADLPYQMLTALVGTAIEASNRSCSLALVCLHEFVTESARPQLLRRNAEDYGAFLKALGVSRPAPGVSYGPFTVQLPGEAGAVQVLVGKVQFKWAR